MQLRKKNPDLLEAFCSAAAARIRFSILMGIGVAIGIVGVVCLGFSLFLLAANEDGTNYCIGGAVIGIIGALCGLAGWNGLRNSHDEVWRFDGATERLVMTNARRDRKTIPFARIVRAEVVDDDDSENTYYVVKLKLREPSEHLQMGIFEQDDAPLKDMATQINRFLQKYNPPSVDLLEANAESAAGAALEAAAQLLKSIWNGEPG
jgi:hypothetical protein